MMHPRMTSLLAPLLGLLSLCACETTATAPAAPAPRLYWDIQRVSADIAVPRMGDAPDISPQFLADGSVVYQEQASGAVRVYHPDGTTSDVPVPTGAIEGGLTLNGARVTWYVDDKNFGGVSTAANGYTLGGGWAWVDGVVRECAGLACIPVLRRPDGTFVTHDRGGQYWMTWKPGQNPAPSYPMLDDLIIQEAPLNLVMPCFVPQQVGSDGSVLVRFAVNGFLDCKNNEPDLPRFQLIRDFKKVDIGKDQFNLGWAVELAGCCDIWGINNLGQILGLVGGVPSIRSSAGVEAIGGEAGQAYGFNDVGDVLYATGLPPTAGKLRLKGSTWDVGTCEVLKQLDDKQTDNPLLTQVLAMRNDGAVLFWATSQANNTAASLYLATPRTQPIPEGVHGQLTFAKIAGEGSAPEVLDAWRVRGEFSDASLTLTLLGQSSDICADRVFSLLATRTNGAWHSGDLIPATTSTLPGVGTVIGVVSYSDGDGSMIAVSGGFRVTDVTKAGFVATAENLVLKRVQTGATFAVSGSAVVKR